MDVCEAKCNLAIPVNKNCFVNVAMCSLIGVFIKANEQQFSVIVKIQNIECFDQVCCSKKYNCY